MTILDRHLIGPDKDLFYSRSDPDDIRMGDVVSPGTVNYDSSDVILLGCPQDEGVLRNKGREGARLAPTEIRRELYKYPVSESHTGLKMCDIGDIRTDAPLEVIHEKMYEIVKQIIADGKKLVVLGGGNDISYPDCSALSSSIPDCLILNIDKHYDVRLDTQRSSGTPYRQLLEEKQIRPDLFYEIAINSFANSPAHKKYLEEQGAHIIYLGTLRENGVGASIREITESSKTGAIFFGFDIDSVRAVDAPGVSAPSPMGLTAREICEIADTAALDKRTRIIEITEVNPVYDQDGITSKLAANIIMRALASPENR